MKDRAFRYGDRDLRDQRRDLRYDEMGLWTEEQQGLWLYEGQGLKI